MVPEVVKYRVGTFVRLDNFQKIATVKDLIWIWSYILNSQMIKE